MTRSVKLGLAGVFLMLGAPVVTFLLKGDSPVGFVFATISCVLGVIAAQQGSKWWLTVPSMVLAATAFLFFVGFQAK